MYNVTINDYVEKSYSDSIYNARERWALYYQVSIVGIKESSIHELITIRAYYPHGRYSTTCLVAVWISDEKGRRGAHKESGYDAMHRSAITAFQDAGITLSEEKGNSGVSDLSDMGIAAAKEIFPDYSAIRAIYANN